RAQDRNAAGAPRLHRGAARQDGIPGPAPRVAVKAWRRPRFCHGRLLVSAGTESRASGQSKRARKARPGAAIRPQALGAPVPRALAARLPRPCSRLQAVDRHGGVGMKVLITGGAGFIGSHLADRLLARRDVVLVIAIYATGRRDSLSPRPGLSLVEGTIADAELVGRVFRDFGPEHVVHAAASYKDPDNWTEDSLTNAVGTANVVQAAKAFAVRRF